MRSRLPLITGILLAVLFILYRVLAFLPPGPQDKAVQLLLLVPAAAAISWYAAGRCSSDLKKKIISTLCKPPTAVFLAVLCTLLFLFSVWMVYGPLEGIPKGGDEAAYYFQSKIYASGSLAAERPDVFNPRAYFPFRHFVFRDSRWFIVYTPFHSLLLAPFTASGIAPLLGPLEGIAALIGIFLLIRFWTSEATARAGVLLLLLSPYFLFMTTTFMAHNTNLMLIVWSLFLMSSAGRSGNRIQAATAGLLAGLAFCTKPYTALVWILYMPAMIIIGCRGRRLRILLPAAFAAAVPFALFLLSNNYYTGNPLQTGYDLIRGGKLIGFGPDRAWFPEYGDYAHTPLRGLINIARQTGTGSTILLGWPFLSVLPMILALRRWTRDRRIVLLFVPVFMVMILMFLHYCPAIDYGPRHYFTLMPVFLILTLTGFGELISLAGNWRGERGRNAATGFIILLFFITTLVYIPEGIVRRSGPWQAIDRQPETLAMGRAELPAVVFMQAGEHGYPNIVSGLNLNSPSLDGEVIYCAHQTASEDEIFMEAFPGRNPYLFWYDGRDFHFEDWSEDLARQLSPTRDMEYHAYSPEQEGNSGE